MGLGVHSVRCSLFAIVSNANLFSEYSIANVRAEQHRGTERKRERGREGDREKVICFTIFSFFLLFFGSCPRRRWCVHMHVHATEGERAGESPWHHSIAI